MLMLLTQTTVAAAVAVVWVSVLGSCSSIVRVFVGYWELVMVKLLLSLLDSLRPLL